MSKTVVIADSQLHAWTAWSRTLPDGTNSRLADGIRSLDFALDLAQGGNLVVLGDLFEDRRSLTLDVLHAAAAWVARAAPRLKNLVLVAGNHDQYFRNGQVTSVSALAHLPNVTLVEDFLEMELSGKKCFISAYHEDAELVRVAVRQSSASVLLIHQALLGAEADGGFVYMKSGALSLKDLQSEERAFILAGHFHKHQQLGENAWFIGAPYQIRLAETGQEKFVASFDSDSVLPDFVPVTCCPKFWRLTAEEYAALSDEQRAIDFFEVKGAARNVTPSPTLRFKVEAPEALTYKEACSDVVSAVTVWLTSRGHDRLIERATALLR